MYLRISPLRKWNLRLITLISAVGLLMVSLLMASRPAMAATPAFMQTKSTSISSAKTVSLSLPSTANGNLLAVYVIWNNTSTATITDNKGNAYANTGAATKFGSASNVSSQVFYAKNIAGGATTVTATFGTTAGADLYIQEYSGLDKVNPLDKTVAAKGNSRTANSGSVTTSNAQDLLLGAGATMSGLMTPGTGFVSRSTAFGNILEDKNVSITGSYSAAATISTSAQWVMHMVAFKAAPAVDTTPPSTPLSVSASATSSTSVTLNWNAATDNVGVTGYKIYRGGTQIGTSTNLTYQDTSLTASTAYTYTISAYDAAGNTSGQSTPVTATTLAPPDTTAPSIPVNVSATALSPSQIDLTWDPSTDNVGVSAYILSRDGTPIATVTGTTYSDTGLTANTTYTYTVTAKDAAGNTSGPSPSASATTPTPPPDTEAPSIPSNVTATATSSTQVRLNWNAATDNVGVTGYTISRDGTLLATTTDTTFNDTNLTANTTYTYTIAATDAAGNTSDSSAPVSVTTTVPMPTLTNRPAQSASVMYGDGGDTSRAITYAHPAGIVAAGRTNYQDQVFKDISAAGGTTLIYLDPMINNNWGRYHTMLINASECGPAVPRWPGNPQANQ